MQNSRPAYLRLPADHYFDHALLVDALKSFASPRAKVSRMLKLGELVQIRRGLYVRSREFGGTVDPVEVANAVYGPSYVSLEYALSWYGLIPERVVAVTSITAKRSRRFDTPVGLFTYAHIPQRAYPVGVATLSPARTGVLFATREKALCDKLACTPNVRTLGEIGQFLEEDQRIDMDDLNGLSVDLLDEIARAYRLRRIALFVHWYRKNYRGGTP